MGRQSIYLSHLRSAGSAERANNKKLSSFQRTLYIINYRITFLHSRPSFGVMLVLSTSEVVEIFLKIFKKYSRTW